jgi:hypothetical protein
MDFREGMYFSDSASSGYGDMYGDERMYMDIYDRNPHMA